MTGGKIHIKKAPGSGTAIETALEVLRLVESSRGGISVSGLVSRSGVAETTIRRILTELERTGRVERIEDPNHQQRQLYRGMTPRASVAPPQLLSAISAALAFKSSSAVWGGLLEERARQMIRDLTGQFGANHAKLLETVIDHVDVSPRGRVKYESKHLDVLFAFLQGSSWGCAVEASYRSPLSSRAKRRRYSLVRLFPQEGALYLVLRDLARDDETRIFALHRFRDAETIRDHPVPPRPSQAPAILDAWQYGDAVEVTLRISKAWLPWFDEREWFEAQKSDSAENGDRLVTTRFGARIDCFRFVLGQVPWVKIESPKELAVELRELVAQVTEG